MVENASNLTQQSQDSGTITLLPEKGLRGVDTMLFK